MRSLLKEDKNLPNSVNTTTADVWVMQGTRADDSAAQISWFYLQGKVIETELYNVISVFISLVVSQLMSA